MRACAIGSLSLGAGLAVLLALLACREQAAERKQAKPEPDTLAVESGEVAPAIYGQPLSGATRASLDEVLRAPEGYANKTLELRGYVRRVCRKKGCWMELASDPTPSAPACRVTFKDYGFFVPTDSQGAQAAVEGTVEVTRVNPGRVAHHEREGAVFPNKRADGSADEVRLVATAVELRR